MKRKNQAKKKLAWRRISVNISEELYALMEDRAQLAGVSLSRLAFSTLKRKQVVVIPGIGELTYQLKELCRKIDEAKCDRNLLERIVQGINQHIAFHQTITGITLPHLAENDAGRVSVRKASPKPQHNLFEV